MVLTWVDTWCRTMSISGNRLNLRNQGGHRMTHNSQSLRELWVAYKDYFVLFFNKNYTAKNCIIKLHLIVANRITGYSESSQNRYKWCNRSSKLK